MLMQRNMRVGKRIMAFGVWMFCNFLGKFIERVWDLNWRRVTYGGGIVLFSE